MNATRVLLIGAKGRMGEAVLSAAQKQSAAIVSARCDRGDDVARALGDCDVAIDFSEADATVNLVTAFAAAKKPLVIGTTGHSAEQLTAVRKSAEKIPIVLAPNFSVGVNAMFWLTRNAAKLLGPDFAVEISETHHRMKKDAPSGTAKKLAEVLRAAGRSDVPIQSLREGDVVGEHTVIFRGASEWLELIHRADSRETFALGALRAARWIVDQPPGLYGMEDVLGLAPDQ